MISHFPSISLYGLNFPLWDKIVICSSLLPLKHLGIYHIFIDYKLLLMIVYTSKFCSLLAFLYHFCMCIEEDMPWYFFDIFFFMSSQFWETDYVPFAIPYSSPVSINRVCALYNVTNGQLYLVVFASNPPPTRDLLGRVKTLERKR